VDVKTVLTVKPLVMKVPRNSARIFDLSLDGIEDLLM
jgi:hypothetical protein